MASFKCIFISHEILLIPDKTIIVRYMILYKKKRGDLSVTPQFATISNWQALFGNYKLVGKNSLTVIDIDIVHTAIHLLQINGTGNGSIHRYVIHSINNLTE